jgi:hypothetical protein
VANMAKAVSLRMVNFMIVVMVSVLLLFVLWCFMQQRLLLIKSGSDLGNNLILTRVSCTWAKDMGL